jgi:hypothetical protein
MDLTDHQKKFPEEVGLPGWKHSKSMSAARSDAVVPLFDGSGPKRGL